MNQNYNNQPYDQQPYGQNQYNPAGGYNPLPPQQPKTPGMAIASLCLGIGGIIVGLLLNCCLFGVGSVIGIIMCIAGLILGIVANNQQKSGVGLAGIIVSGVGIALLILFLIGFAAIFAELYDQLYYELF